MKPVGILAWSLVAIAVVVSGCAKAAPTLPTATGVPNVLVTPSAPVSVPATPSASPTPSPAPSAVKLVLSGTGMGGLPFGTSQARVTKVIQAALGKPTDKTQGKTCELDAASPWGETLVYGNLWVQFTAADDKKTSPRTLTAWGYELTKPLPGSMEIADGVPLNLTFAQLKAKYPTSTEIELGLGDGTRALELPNKLGFIGIDKPEVIGAGEIALCE